MKLKTLLSIIALGTVISCEQITDNYYEHQSQENYTSPYMGKWVGSYSGQQAGNITLSVSKSGSITGTYGPNNEMLISAVLDSGSLLPVNSDTPIFTLYGSLNDKKGTWKNDNLTGNWTLTKQ